jgi:hypothetical protein
MCIICSTPINALQNIETIVVDECDKIETVPYMSNLRDMVLCGCPNLKNFEDLPSLQRLVLRECNIETIPVFPQLTNLIFENCKNLKVIPLIESLLEVSFENCPYIETIPLLPNLRRLYCSVSPNLNKLEVHPELAILYMRMSFLEEIPVFPNLRSLVCESCHNLKSIPSMPSLLRLKIESCEAVEKIHTQPALIKADLNYCDVLEELFEANRLAELYIDECHLLKSIPRYPMLLKLYINQCENVTSIPPMNTLNELGLEEVGVREITGFTLLDTFCCINLKHLVKIEGVPMIENFSITNAPMLLTLPPLGVEDGTVDVEDCPWLSVPENENYERNVSGLRKIQRQMKVSMMKRRMTKFTTLRKKTPLPDDICHMISRM